MIGRSPTFACEIYSISLLHVAPPKLELVATFAVGNEPRGVAFSGDGKLAYVALSSVDAVISVNLKQQKTVVQSTTRRLPNRRRPSHH